jgi:site-specific DNA-methyltransferase (adenine-specific)
VTLYYQDESVTLYHGDCLEILTWLDADVLVTDPPYGMAWEGGYTYKGRDVSSIANDETTVVRDIALELWGARHAAVFARWSQPVPGGTRRLVWWKRGIGPGTNSELAFGGASEDIWLIGQWLRRVDVIKKPDVLVTDEHRSTYVGKSGHPSPKPVSLMESLIESAPDGTIADPFAGSGSTLVAARNLGRKAIGVEIEERYCEVIAKRLAQGVLL